MPAHIISANDLIEGDVVYLTAQKDWSGNILDAHVVEDKDQLEEFNQIGQEAIKNNQVIDAHAVPVTVEDNIIIPRHIKERIRAKGPSIHPQFGKQSENEQIANAFNSF